MLTPAMSPTLLLFLLLLGAALVWDVMWLRIPNWIPLTLAGLFVVAALPAQHSSTWWLSHLAAGLGVLAVGIALFAWRKIGGGDAKLLAAIALWAGLKLLPSLFLVIGVVNGAVALAYLTGRASGIGAFLAGRGLPVVSLQPGKDFPFAVAAAIGCFLLRADLISAGP
jgi:prepilin peptidase CpaA